MAITILLAAMSTVVAANWASDSVYKYEPIVKAYIFDYNTGSGRLFITLGDFCANKLIPELEKVQAEGDMVYHEVGVALGYCNVAIYSELAFMVALLLILITLPVWIVKWWRTRRAAKGAMR